MQRGGIWQDQISERQVSGMTERKRIITTVEGAHGGNPGTAIIAEAVFDAEKERVIVYDVDGNEIARADVTPGDDPWTVARRLLPRPAAPSFWRPQPRGPGVPF